MSQQIKLAIQTLVDLLPPGSGNVETAKTIWSKFNLFSKGTSMFGLPNLQVLGLGALLVAAGVGYHFLVTKSMEATIANQKAAMTTLTATVGSLEKANEGLANSIDQIQQKQKDIAETMAELARADQVTADTFNDIRESIAGNTSLEKLNQKLLDKPDETIDAINAQINCMLRNLGEPTTCLQKNTVVAVPPVPKLPKK